MAKAMLGSPNSVNDGMQCNDDEFGLHWFFGCEKPPEKPELELMTVKNM